MAGRIPNSFIDELLTRVDIVDLINSRVHLKKAGKDYQACCPFHEEKTPSFTVSREKQFYHCFGCGAHGSAIGFLMEHDNLSFVEAVEELALRERLEVPREDDGRPRGPDHRPLFELMGQISRIYQQQLRSPQGRRAIEYLKQRGLNGEIARDFDIGYAPSGHHRLVEALGDDAQTLKQLITCGMLIEPEEGDRPPYDRFRDRVMFPIHDHRGQVIGFGGRIIGEGKPKYLNSPETPLFHKGRELYGLYQARKANRQLDRLLVVEGYMDVVALAQFGVRNAVATLGTATTPEHMEKLFRSCQEVIFCFDGDRAGRDAAWKALNTSLPLMRDGRQVRFLFLPDDEDPDTLVRKEGTEAFTQRLKNATPLSDFLFAELTRMAPGDSDEARVKLAELARPLLEQLPRGLLRQMLFARLSETVGLTISDQSPFTFRKGDRPSEAQHKRAQTHRPLQRQSLGTLPPVRRAVALLVSFPHFAQIENLPTGWQELKQTPGIKLLQELLELLQRHPNLSAGAIEERWRDRPEGRHLGRLAGLIHPIPEEGLSREFVDTLQALSLRAREEETSNLISKAREQGLTAEEKLRLASLLARRQDLDKC